LQLVKYNQEGSSAGLDGGPVLVQILKLLGVRGFLELGCDKKGFYLANLNDFSSSLQNASDLLKL
jgi:hypothetical protein